MTHNDSCVLTSGGSTEAHRLLRHTVGWPKGAILGD